MVEVNDIDLLSTVQYSAGKPFHVNATPTIYPNNLAGHTHHLWHQHTLVALVLQQDNAYCHTAVQELPEERGKELEVKTWPPQIQI